MACRDSPTGPWCRGWRRTQVWTSMTPSFRSDRGLDPAPAECDQYPSGRVGNRIALGVRIHLRAKPCAVAVPVARARRERGVRRDSADDDLHHVPAVGADTATVAVGTGCSRHRCRYPRGLRGGSCPRRRQLAVRPWFFRWCVATASTRPASAQLPVYLHFRGDRNMLCRKYLLLRLCNEGAP